MLDGHSELEARPELVAVLRAAHFHGPADWEERAVQALHAERLEYLRVDHTAVVEYLFGTSGKRWRIAGPEVAPLGDDLRAVQQIHLVLLGPALFASLA